MTPSVQILLTGQGGQPQLAVTQKPDPLALSAVACPAADNTDSICSTSGVVTLANIGLVNLLLTSTPVLAPAAGQTSVPAGLTLGSFMSTTTTLFPQDTLAIPIDWAPPGPLMTQQTASAMLVVKSDDAMTPEVDVPITLTALPASNPVACASVLAVSQRVYVTSTSGGAPTVSASPVPTAQWEPAAGDATNTIRVKPGMTLTVTSQKTTTDASGNPEVDSAGEMSDPCTADPNGFTLTRNWSLTKPSTSFAELNPHEGDRDGARDRRGRRLHDHLRGHRHPRAHERAGDDQHRRRAR